MSVRIFHPSVAPFIQEAALALEEGQAESFLDFTPLSRIVRMTPNATAHFVIL